MPQEEFIKHFDGVRKLLAQVRQRVLLASSSLRVLMLSQSPESDSAQTHALLLLFWVDSASRTRAATKSCAPAPPPACRFACLLPVRHCFLSLPAAFESHRGMRTLPKSFISWLIDPVFMWLWQRMVHVYRSKMSVDRVHKQQLTVSCVASCRVQFAALSVIAEPSLSPDCCAMRC